MSRPSSQPRSRTWALILTVALAGAALASQPTALSTEGEWIQVAEGEPHTARHTGVAGPPTLDPRVDLTGVFVHEDGDLLELRLETRDDPVPPSVQQEDAWIETTLTFHLFIRETKEKFLIDLIADPNGFRLERDGTDITSKALTVSPDSQPWSYEVGIHRDQVLPEGVLELGDRLQNPVAEAIATYPSLPPASDRAPESGKGTEYILQMASNGGIAPVWRTVTGHEYAAGPSLAVASDDTVHVAYIVYNDEREASKGLYHAILTEQEEDNPLESSHNLVLKAERVADAELPEEIHQDAKTATAMELDAQDRPHIVYHPLADGENPGKIRFATKAGGSWSIEDPAKTTNGILQVTDSHRSIPAIVVDQDRVIVAFQSEDDVQIVERTGKDDWERLTTIQDARFPKLALDSSGNVHVAWFHETSDQSPNRGVYGDLLYAHETGRFKAKTIAQEVIDLSKFWETSETDGSFAFDLDLQDRPHFVWETDHDDRVYAVMDQGSLQKEASGLKPVHGNPQLRIRLDIDANGDAHIISGYGGTDMYALRSSDGGWLRTDIDRFDMSTLAIRSDGRAVIAHTQPHGGTTFALALQERPGLPGLADPNATNTQDQDEEEGLIPAPAPLVLIAALAGILARLRRSPTEAMRGVRRTSGHWIRSSLALLLVAAVCASGAPASAGGATQVQEEQWHVLIEDDPAGATYDLPGSPPAADPRLDIDTIYVREASSAIWFRFTTLASRLESETEQELPENEETIYKTVLEFRLDLGNSTHIVEIIAEVDQFIILVDGIPRPFFLYEKDSRPWDYELGLSRFLFAPETALSVGDTIHSAKATSEGRDFPAPAARDRAPDVGTTGKFVLTLIPPEPPEWLHSTGPDYAAGPDLATGPDDTVHIAYVVSSGDRDAEQGLYHGTLELVNDPLNETQEIVLDAQRVGDFTNRDRPRQHDTLQVALGVDAEGTPHILYHPDPHGSQGQIRYTTKTEGGWITEDPADVVGSRTLPVINGLDAIPWIATGTDRIIAGLPTIDGFAIVERTGTDRWEVLHEVNDGRFPRVELDSDETLHLAWFQPYSEQGDGSQEGDLLYTSESRGWQRMEIAQEIHERTHGWTSASNDGSFAFAIGPGDLPHFIWESSGAGGWDQRYAILDEDLETEIAPFSSYGGNILRMRIAFDGEGTAHMATGRGSLETYATRQTDGTWTMQETESIDIFNLAVRSNGESFYTGTQRHGGASLHLAGTTTGPTGPLQQATEQNDDEVALLPPAPMMLGLVAVAGGLLVFTAGARRLADTHPRAVWLPLAFVGGFSRLNKKKVMQHITRESILEAVTAEPGRSAATVRSTLELPRSTFYYHLRRLEQEEILKVKRKGRDLLLYHAETPPQKVPLTETDRELLRTLNERPGGTASEYARLVAAQERTIRNRLRRLEEMRVVERYVTNPREIRWSALHEAEIGEAS